MAEMHRKQAEGEPTAQAALAASRQSTDVSGVDDEPFERVDPAEVAELAARGARLFDVREPYEWSTGHIADSRLVPLGTLLAEPRRYLLGPGSDPEGGTSRAAVGEAVGVSMNAPTITDRPIVFICAAGIRSALACEMAAAVGFVRVYNLEGGIVGWSSLGYPLE